MTSSSYWPHLRDEVLHATHGTTPPSLQCMICLEPTSAQDEHSHQSVVIPCGHIFGRYCLEAWTASFVGRNAPSCPTCRGTLVHPGCGHLTKSIPVPSLITAEPQHICHTGSGRSENVKKALQVFSSTVRSYHVENNNRAALQAFPLTIPEGGSVSQRCADCVVSELLSLFTMITSPETMMCKIGAAEFVGFTAKAGEQRWVLHRRGLRAKTIRPLEPRPELFQTFQQIRSFVEGAEKGHSWPSTDLKDLDFEMCLCRWEDPSGWT